MSVAAPTVSADPEKRPRWERLLALGDSDHAEAGDPADERRQEDAPEIGARVHEDPATVLLVWAFGAKEKAAEQKAAHEARKEA
jgi:hypothetical protein